MSGHKNRRPGTIGRENLLRLAVSTALLTLTACGGGSGGEEWLNLSNLQGSEPEIGAAIDGSLDGSLAAELDIAETTAGESITVAVLSNDNLNTAQRMRLAGTPENGTVELLPTGELRYTADEGFEGSDSVDYIIADAQGNEVTATLHLSVLCSACDIAPASENDVELTANPDSFDVVSGEVRTVSPLTNDSIADKANIQFSLDSEPSAGKLLAAQAGVLVYNAPDNYTGSDQIVYRITDAEGNSSSASIDFNVTCEVCLNHDALRLSWPANPEAEAVDGYRVFFGPDENSHTASLLDELPSASVSDDGPSAIYSLAADLNIENQEGGCFTIEAYRGAEVSERSEPACFTRG